MFSHSWRIGADKNFAFLAAATYIIALSYDSCTMPASFFAFPAGDESKVALSSFRCFACALKIEDISEGWRRLVGAGGSKLDLNQPPLPLVMGVLVLVVA